MAIDSVCDEPHCSVAVFFLHRILSASSYLLLLSFVLYGLMDHCILVLLEPSMPFSPLWRTYILNINMLITSELLNKNVGRQTEGSRCMLAWYTHPFKGALFPGLPGWAGTRRVKPIWILLKQETVSGSGFSWAMCKSAPHSTQITTPAPHHSVFYRPDAFPATQPTASKHWKQ